MRFDATPVLDPRTAADVLAELRQRRPSFLPEWLPVEGDAGEALSRIAARYGQVVIDRLNQAPDRAFLAFLDALGINLIPAQPARVPVVFKAFAGMGDGRAPEGTRVGAEVPGSQSPIVFETTSAIALAGARLTDVVAIWPDRDACAMHSVEATGGRPFTLFTPLAPIPHALYVAHDTVFDVAKDAVIEVSIELATPASAPLATAWEYWDGQNWQPFKPFSADATTGSQDGTAGFLRSGSVALRLTCGRPEKTTVMGIEARWIRCLPVDPLPPDPARVLPTIDRIRTRALVNWAPVALELDAASAGALPLDVSGTFHPFGRVAIPGAVFYLACDEAFGKPGASVSVTFDLPADPPLALASLKVRWQYWDGRQWTTIAALKEGGYLAPSVTTILSFTVPADIAATEVNGDRRHWLRAQLVAGGYIVKWQMTNPVDATKKIDMVDPAGPIVTGVRVIYRWRPPSEPVERCCTCNDFRFESHSRDIRWPGDPFAPFQPTQDATPTIYLGFDRPLPNDLVSLYFDVAEDEHELPALTWEGFDGERWLPLAAADESLSLGRPGIVSFIAPAVQPRPSAGVRSASGSTIVTASALEAAAFQPGQLVVLAQADQQESVRVAAVSDRTLTLDAPLAARYTGGTVTLAGLPRFGAPRDWIRARLEENGAPAAIPVTAIHLNAATAVQTQAIAGEVLGSGNGQPLQTLFFSQSPVLPGEQIEVRELEGARASVELPILRDELLQDGFTDDDLRTVADPRTGKVREVWVRWRARPHLYFSGATDRHYVVERARGRLSFGDGVNGRLPTVATDNIRARVYRAGGGLVGNVPRGAIARMLGGAFAESVFNPRGADGGADGESPVTVKDRGPETLRHRWRAISAKDYEAMARESSPAVAAVRVLPATASNLRPAPGRVTVIVVPQSQDPRPQPSLELRQHVHAYLAARLPGTLPASHVAVIGPTYLAVGATALAVPRVRGEAGLVADRLKAALFRFLHPLSGGPEAHGWDFGRDVFLSDVAALLEAVPGVDHVAQLDLLLDDAPVGPRVEVPPDRIVVAGALRIVMQAEV